MKHRQKTTARLSCCHWGWSQVTPGANSKPKQRSLPTWLTGEKSKTAQSHPGKPLAINYCFFAVSRNWRRQQVIPIPQSSSRNAPRGVMDPLPKTSTAAQAPGPHMHAATWTPPHQLSPALWASLRQGNTCPPATQAAAATPRGQQEDTLWSRALAARARLIPGKGL